MNLKWIGAILIIAACGGFGTGMVISHRRKEAALKQLLTALDYMECQLQYHLTPLPELCRQAALRVSGGVGTVLTALARELDRQISPDVKSCMEAAVCSSPELPVVGHFRELGNTLGIFDLQGQLKGLEGVCRSCRQELERLGQNREVRLRSYQTLGLCAGAALAILFI